MTEATEKLQAAYRSLVESPGGKHLIEWIEKSAADQRQRAGKSEPIPAWGELRFADGKEDVLTHIKQMCGLESIGKKR